jgi:hypothetical protein
LLMPKLKNVVTDSQMLGKTYFYEFKYS